LRGEHIGAFISGRLSIEKTVGNISVEYKYPILIAVIRTIYVKPKRLVFVVKENSRMPIGIPALRMNNRIVAVRNPLTVAIVAATENSENEAERKTTEQPAEREGHVNSTEFFVPPNALSRGIAAKKPDFKLAFLMPDREIAPPVYGI
jgi:hypothetical protein